MSAPRNWNHDDEAQREAEARVESEREEWARLHAAVFGAGAGQKLLEAYHKGIVDRVLPVDADERALCVLNGQRQFVRRIERLTEMGLQAKPKAT